jgi:valyl-tRNA synthetase
MIIAGYEYRSEKPFSNVYLTGIVRDKQGRKMSKSLGNSPDPLDLIERYSADGVRVGMLLASPAGNDLLFDESLCEQGRNFANKIWNAFRLVKGWNTGSLAQTASNKKAVQWFAARFSEQLEILNEQYAKYRMSEALMTTYKLIWDDFCSWYLEMIKPEFINGESQPIDKLTYEATVRFFENILKVLHPWMPFITEEIWHLIKERDDKECILVEPWPAAEKTSSASLHEFEHFAEVVSQVRNIRNAKGISPKEQLSLMVRTEGREVFSFADLAVKLCNLKSVAAISDKPEKASSFIVANTEYFVPLGEAVDLNEEKGRLQKELDYNKGFLKSVQSKLANERFVANAKPEVVAVERKKEADAMAKIKSLEEQLSTLD